MEWVVTSAAMLIIGGLALVVGFGMSPFPQDEPLAHAIAAASEVPGQWLASAVTMFLASLALTLGAFALLSLLRRDRRFAVFAVGLYLIGTIGMCGYATAMAFLRGLVVNDLLVPTALDDIGSDAATRGFIAVWLGAFVLGLVLIAFGLLRNGEVPKWVPVVILGFVASQFLPLRGGNTSTLIQFAVLAVALAKAGMAANEFAHTREVETAFAKPAPSLF